MYTVYEIETPEGKYVGVTGRSIKTRLNELRCRRNFNGVIRAIANFKDRNTALTLELELRPDYRMGLNRGRGGRHQSLPSFGAANGMAKRVRVKGVEYPTVIAAARAHGVSETVASYRLRAPGFPAWTYAIGGSHH
jgi:hypothetical protein